LGLTSSFAPTGGPGTGPGGGGGAAGGNPAPVFLSAQESRCPPGEGTASVLGAVGRA
jgi:hypothetical protein